LEWGKFGTGKKARKLPSNPQENNPKKIHFSLKREKPDRSSLANDGVLTLLYRGEMGKDFPAERGIGEGGGRTDLME